MLERWKYRLRRLREHPAPGRFLASRLLWHSGVSRLFTAELPDGVRVRFYPSALSAALWANPTGRSVDASVIRDTLVAGDVYVDCGANIGQLALIAAKCVGPSGQVVAVEANPRVARFLQGNLLLNDVSDVRVVVAALGDTDGGEVRISDRRDDDQNAISDEGSPVPMRTLDSILGAVSEVTLLKIDVEGYEAHALRGARGLLSRTRVVYCELSPDNCRRYGSTPGEVEDMLLGAGFLLRDPGNPDHFRGNPVFAELSASELPPTGYNLLAVQSRYLDWYRDRTGRGSSDTGEPDQLP